MDRDQLLRLLSAAGDSLERLRADQPELAAALSAQAGRRVRTRMREAFPPDRESAVLFEDLESGALTRQEVLDAVRARVSDPALPEPVRAQGLTRLTRIETGDTALGPAADPATPLAELPDLQPELEAARLHLVGEVAGVPADVVGRVAERGLGVSTVTGDVLRPLVERGVLEPAQAERVTLTAALYQLAGRDRRVTEALTAPLPELGGAAVTRLSDLAGLDAADWRSVLDRAGVTAIAGRSRDEFADEVRGQVVAMFPTESLLAALRPPPADQLREAIEGARTDRLTRLARTYPGLNLAAILADDGRGVEERARLALDRIGLLRRVAERNPGADLLAFDFSTGSDNLATLDLGDLDEEQQTGVLRTLAAYQRVTGVTSGPDEAAAVLAGGFASAHEIAVAGPAAFASAAGLTPVAADRVRAEAEDVVARATAGFGALAGLARVEQETPPAAQPQPDVRGYLLRLPGYAELFGSQSGCRCEECASILGPAAYFVDLMHFVERTVAVAHFAGPRVSHPLHLRNRRPDLWTLPLTCANATSRVPALDIVAAVLENAIAADTGRINLADRAAVLRTVYRNTLAAGSRSFQQPFTLPLAEVDTYLRHLGPSRAELATRLGKPADVVTLAVLGLTPAEQTLLTSEVTELDRLSELWAVTFAAFAQPGSVAPIDVPDLLTGSGLTRTELEVLLTAPFVTATGAAPRIVAERVSDQSVQADVERVRDLTVAALDRMHRLARLRRHTAWDLRETATMLAALQVNQLGDAELGQLALTLTLGQRLGVTADELAGLVGLLPAGPIGGPGGGDPLFDRFFNVVPFDGPDVRWPAGATRFVHPSLRPPGSAADDAVVHRLLSALRISEGDLVVLVQRLAVPLSEPGVPGPGFALTTANLSVLHRHARVAALLSVPVTDLFRLLALTGRSALTGPADLTAVVEIHDWLAGLAGWWPPGGTALDHVEVAIGTAPLPGAAPAEQAATVVATVTAEGPLRFADTLLAFVPEVSEAGSRQVLAENTADPADPAATVWVERTPGGAGYRLLPGVDPAVPLRVPPGLVINEPAARQLLLRHHPQSVLPPVLARVVGLPTDTVTGLLPLTGEDLSTTGYARELLGEQPPTSLTRLIRRVRRLAETLGHPAFDPDALNWLSGHRGMFGLGNPDAITLDSLRALAAYTALTATGPEPRFSGGAPVPAAADVRAVLGAHTVADGFSAADVTTAARVLGCAAQLVPGLLREVPPAGPAPTALARIAAVASTSAGTGVPPAALALAVSHDYDDLTAASAAIQSAFRAKYADEQTWSQRRAPFEEALRVRKRDALADHLLHLPGRPFATRSELYAHFLLDTEIDGCVTVSPLVSAISSVQLYVHRCVLGLEQEAGDAPDAVRVLPDDIPQVEWSWRRNFRVWQANRKVFLYPENYLDPELRDDRTPLFRDLEATLLQTEIRDDDVVDAYTRYLSSFDELGRLAFAGSYLDYANDVWHLFGVTRSDPATYYYRQVRDLVRSARGASWGPWEPLDLRVPGRMLSPVIHRGRLHAFWTDITTAPQTIFSSGTAHFLGYQHKFALRHVTRRSDGSWATPQELPLAGITAFAGAGVIVDPLINGRPLFAPAEVHTGPVDGYTLRGPLWQGVFPAAQNNKIVLLLAAFNGWVLADPALHRTSPYTGQGWISGGPVMQLDNTTAAPWRLYTTSGQELVAGVSQYVRTWLVVDQAATGRDIFGGGPAVAQWRLEPPLLETPAETTVAPVNGSPTTAVVLDVAGDLLLVAQQRWWHDQVVPYHQVNRIGTTLAQRLTDALFTGGIDGFFAPSTQESLVEPPLPVTLHRAAAGLPLPPHDGPYGGYFRELYLHIPYLTARNLNAQQRFAASQRWYHRLFDPTAPEDVPVPAGATPPERAALQRMRVWRYLPFRNLDVPSLRAALTDPAALRVYREQPFSPHAIARIRPGAYQKSVVMSYLDNLLDWGDTLFAQFTTESVNEATMLYALAADILGPRPAELGPCSTPAGRTYADIGPALTAGAELLIELETQIAARSRATLLPPGTPAADPLVLVLATAGTGPADAAGAAGTAAGGRVTGRAAGVRRPEAATLVAETQGAAPSRVAAAFGMSVTQQIGPVFCVPPNTELRGYWDRVADRLAKIRSCQDITGARRTLALFAPEIDPRLLARARAAGLSLEDVLGTTSGSLPPYRFSFLIDKAKASVGTVQAFGSALLSALERKDGEELARLRMTQQQNLLQMTTAGRELEIDAAREAHTALKRQQDAVQARMQHYLTLSGQPPTPAPGSGPPAAGGAAPAGDDLSKSLNESERTQLEDTNTARDKQKETINLEMAAGIAHLFPQVGAPTSMKYGGIDVGNSIRAVAGWHRAQAAQAEARAGAAGLRAGFERRLEGWKQQIAQAEKELAQLTPQLAAAQIRVEFAEHALTVQNLAVAQAEELDAFYADRLTGLGLYTWLSTSMQRLYRQAYNSAFGMTRLAEQAFRFERDEAPPPLGTGHWESARAGLLAGERLLLDLQALEQRFLETDRRSLEVDQAFALSQLDPYALLRLRETGRCEFSVPELAFDLAYPGQFRRRIRTARLSVPCVTGPYTNVGLTLTLTASEIRREPRLGNDVVRDVPPRHTASVATSTAQNDAGVFELSFQDQRYVPFEGAGAVSTWLLELPTAFKPFDYRTISDVVLHLAYSAAADGALRTEVERVKAPGMAPHAQALESRLLDTPLRRVFSLRQEFSSAFHRLLHGPPGTEVTIAIDRWSLPLFLGVRPVTVSRARLVLQTPAKQSVTGVSLTMDDVAQTGFAAEADLGDLPATGLGTLLQSTLIGDHKLKISAAGPLAPVNPAVGDLSALDETKVSDILIAVEFSLAALP